MKNNYQEADFSSVCTAEKFMFYLSEVFLI